MTTTEVAVKAAVKKLIGVYEKLTPAEQKEARRELLSRVGRDASAGARSVEVERERPTGSTYRFEPPSDQLLSYWRDVIRAFSAYLPQDSYQPGDEDRLDLPRDATRRAIEPLEWLLKTYFRYEVHGLENIPSRGRAIIVSNHGLLPVDGWFLSYEIARACGRWPRGLTDWRIYRLPYLRQFFMDMGAIEGTHGNGDALLEHEELVFIMPGGSKEAWKSSKYRYRLLWRGRNGFIRLALRNQSPIIPSANVGTDDTYHVLFDGYTTAYKLFRSKKALFPISLPIGLGILPFPVKLTQYVGEPIHFGYPPEAAEDPEIVADCQALIKSKVYELIDRGLREREERSVDRFGL